MSGSEKSEIYLEIKSTPNGLDIAAIDSTDGLEVKFCAPLETPESEIAALAKSKLDYVRSKQAAEQDDVRPTATHNKRRGIIV